MKINTYISLGVAGFLAIGAMSCSNPINPFGGTGTGTVDSIIGARNGGGAVDTLHKLIDSLGRHGKPHDSLGGGHGMPHDSLGGHPPDSLGGGHGMPHDTLGGHPPDSLGGGHGMPHDTLGGHPPDSLHHGRGRK